MKQWQVLRTVFPPLITENFEFVDYQESESRLDYWFDEREWLEREDYKKGSVHPYGFTPEKTILDFPFICISTHVIQKACSYPEPTYKHG